MTHMDLNPESLKGQAKALLLANQLPAAKAIYARLCEMAPNDVQLWHTLGTINARLGNFEEAAGNWRRAVTIKPDFAEGHCNLGNALVSMGRSGEALRHYRDALRIQPDYSEALNNMGTTFNELNRLDEAAQHYEAALRVAPSAPVHYNLANVYTRQRRLDEAVTHYRWALAMMPNQPNFNKGLGNALYHLGRYADAEAAYREALRVDPDHASAFETHANLGSALLQMHRLSEARACYSRALELKPDYPRGVAGIASVLEKQGKFEEAFTLIQPYLDAHKDDCNIALAFASFCRHLGKCEEAIVRMERLLAGQGPSVDAYDRILLHFALGRLLDDAAEYDRAFDHYRRGNDLCGRRVDPEAHIRYIETLIKTYDASFMPCAPRAGHGSRRPVFIVGMPRSGTSLVEQILASHPAVFGAGELDEIKRIANDMPGTIGVHTPYPECVRNLTQTHVEEFAKRYLDHISKLAPKDARLITDKTPGNFTHLGLINMLFPEARVIHCVRNPLDTCLSCYFQHFSDGQFFTYNLADLGVYYRQYLRLMEHYRSVLKIPMLVVCYEELLADQEGVSRKIIEYCGLDWDDRCLRFHENQRIVRTASYDQVRQPLYRHSVDRWRHYERYLEPLRLALGKPDVG